MACLRKEILTPRAFGGRCLLEHHQYWFEGWIKGLANFASEQLERKETMQHEKPVQKANVARNCGAFILLCNVATPPEVKFIIGRNFSCLSRKTGH